LERVHARAQGQLEGRLAIQELQVDVVRAVHPQGEGVGHAVAHHHPVDDPAARIVLHDRAGRCQEA
jgi:hypothetical protein